MAPPSPAAAPGGRLAPELWTSGAVAPPGDGIRLAVRWFARPGARLESPWRPVRAGRLSHARPTAQRRDDSSRRPAGGAPRSRSPGAESGWTPAGRQGGPRPRPATTGTDTDHGAGERRSGRGRPPRLRASHRKRVEGHGRRHHAPAPRERRPLRAPDPPVEPEDEALHHDRAQRDLHHRPAAVAGLHRPRLRVHQGHRRQGRHRDVRRHQEAGPGGDRRAGDPRRDALRQPALAGRHAHQLPDRAPADQPPQGARRDRLRRRRRLRPHEEGAPADEAGARQARQDPRRHPRHDPHARPRSGSSTPRRSTSRSRRPASCASRSSASWTPTATPTRSTSRSRATTTPSAPSRC